MGTMIKKFGIPTRLQIQGYSSLYALAFVSTGLQMPLRALEDEYYPTKDIHYRFIPDQKKDSGTVITLYPSLDFTLGETIFSSNADIDNLDLEDFVLKPMYISEFKIKVGTLKVDSSLPKIFD